MSSKSIDISYITEVVTVGKDKFDIVTPGRTFHFEVINKGIIR